MRDYLGESNGVEHVIERATRAFGGIAAPPHVGSQVPADVNRRREESGVVAHFEANEADNALVRDALDGPLSEAVLIETRFDVVDKVVALLSSQRLEAVAHHLG